eukprot:TRINITY_DN64_c0_g1_i1.p2 TRINITY_DN64_c0_g1~~TRINITY_DN64_c0_g1_i1.p2  ORF type:complete len:602 (-),score=332.37 TRINITY_DN64_c0_g1_i1:59-1864(-)
MALYTKKNVYAATPATARGKAVLLGGDPKGNNFLYTCGQSVIIRNIRNPLLAETYDDHQRAPTVARYSPSGNYIASGDSAGTVRIWDATQPEHILKIELPVLAGAIYDLAWSPDNQRIVVGGDGREKYGHVFIWDSGSSVGEISGHAKPIYSVDMKPSRPFRVVTGSEDFAMNFYAGPPFKYQHAIKNHTRFVNCVRFSPDGNLFASAGSDKKIFLFDGKEGQFKAELGGEGAHTGGVYSVSWGPDSSKLITASGDRTTKLWDVNTGQCITTFNFGEGTENQQVGTLWQGEFLLSVNLDGHISYLDVNNPSNPIQVLKGHNKFVTALAYDAGSQSFYSGSYDSVITKWNVNTGENQTITGSGHSNKIEGAAILNTTLFTGAMDDSVRFTPLDSNQYNGDAVSVDSPVTSVDGRADTAVASSLNKIFLFKNKATLSSLAVDYNPKSIALSPNGTTVAVGGDDAAIYLYNIGGGSFAQTQKLTGHSSGVTALSFSPDGSQLASGSKDRAVYVWDSASGELKLNGWKFHSAVVNSVAWSPDGRLIASGSLDQNVYVWDTQNPRSKIQIPLAHRAGVNKVTWINERTVLSAGQDSCSKSWAINIA